MAGPLCDDCLCQRSGMASRQIANRVSRALQHEGFITRTRRLCPSCKKLKLVNSLTCPGNLDDSDFRENSVESDVSAPASSNRVWFWEGNVQRRIVDSLSEAGHTVRVEADTASRARGKDVETRTPGGEKLWVSVKGFPENKRSQNTQARHWFSQALFDMILYRDEDPYAELAIGLPAGFTTYRNLSQRVDWFKSAVPFRIFWVHQDGRVDVE